MADSYMSVGPAGKFHKKLQDNNDGTYSDAVYIDGVIADLNMDISAADLGVAAEAAATTGTPTGTLLQGDTGGTDNKRKNVAVDTDGHLQVDIVSQPSTASVTRISLRVAITASQTGATVWTPTTGKKFVLKKLVVSAKAAGDIEFFDGTDSGNTVVGPILSLAANGGWAEAWEYPYVSAAIDNVLKYTTGSGITGSVYVEGWEI